MDSLSGLPLAPRAGKDLCRAVSLPDWRLLGNPALSTGQHRQLEQSLRSCNSHWMPCNQSDDRLAPPLSRVNSPIPFQDLVSPTSTAVRRVSPGPATPHVHGGWKHMCNLIPGGIHFLSHSAGHATWPHGFRGGVWILLGVQGWRAVAELLDIGEEGAFEARVGVLRQRRGALPPGCHITCYHL